MTTKHSHNQTCANTNDEWWDEPCANCGEMKSKHLVSNEMKDIKCPNPTTENQRFKSKDG